MSIKTISKVLASGAMAVSLLPLAPVIAQPQDEPIILAPPSETKETPPPDRLPSAQPAQGPTAPADAQGKEKALKLPLTEVIGTSPDAMEHIPGSGRVITKEALFENHRFTINEALREVPGVVVRDEDGFGIRPNIGIRGLDPTRSRKVHIMEDGVPIMMMPYGDPSSYYFPPVFRFDRIEVLKGSGQLLYGPQTIGGVMNMITRMPPATPGGNFQLTAGNLSYVNTHLDFGGTWGKNGYLMDVTHFQGETPRFTNQRAQVNDATFKTVQELTDRSTILFKFNYYQENSGIGYQGLTEGEYANNPRYTPFTNDNFDFRRMGLHVAHQYMINAHLSATTNFFGHYISRDWTRQVTQTGTCAGAPAGFNTSNAICATATSALPGNGRYTNAREYTVYGVEPRLHSTYRLFGVNSETDFGARFMYEESNRLQTRNLTSGLGQSCFGGSNAQSCIGENNLRTTNAFTFFIQNRFLLTDQITITPGLRFESVNYTQQDRTANNGNGKFNKAATWEPLPGIGATYSPSKNYTFFAGVHRGFAPPQISDAIQSNVVVDLDAELSWNYELGLRNTPTYWMGNELTFFRMDFQNQIISQSAAGGTGATLTNGGRTRHQGIEFATKMDLLDLMTGPNKKEDLFLQFNYTWVADAEFRGTRNSSLSRISLLPGEQLNGVSVSGNRLPYAPESMLEAAIGYINRPIGFDGRLETQCISDMFSDDRNTYAPTPNGQRGIIKGWCMINLAANQYVKPLHSTFYFVTKNMFDQSFIVDRSRGIYSGLPALYQAGLRWSF
jgi:Fe(3+) dicitrate transport protein